MHIKSRDLMAPDTEPTDEELALVLRAAEGRAVKAYGDAPTWADPILERLTLREI
jgi:hypothetical protein